MEEKICGRLEREKCWVNNKMKAKEVLKLSSSPHKEAEGCTCKGRGDTKEAAQCTDEKKSPI